MRFLAAAICVTLFLPDIVLVALVLGVARTAGRGAALATRGLRG